MATPAVGRVRLWRMRRRNQHVDAVLAPVGRGWELTFVRNERPLLAWRYDLEAEARAEAGRRQRTLELGGWTSHW